MQQQQPKPQQQQLPVKKEQSSSDDNAIRDQVLATHSPDGRDRELEPILHVIEETLSHAISASSKGVNDGTHDGPDALAGDVRGIPDDDDLAREILNISRVFSCKCLDGKDLHELTMTILKMLSVYNWEAKMVISLGAFSVNFGEFWLVAQLSTSATNPFANSIALLKRLPNIIKHYKPHEPQGNALNDLIKAMLEVTRFIIEFKKQSGKSSAWKYDIPTGVYSCIKSMVVWATQLTSLLRMNYEHEYIANSEAWIRSDLAMVQNFHKPLQEILDHFIKIQQTISQHKGIMEIINVFFDDDSLLYGFSGAKVNVNELSKKTVLLLISDLDISDAEVQFLANIYSEKQRNHQYEVVWVPVVDGPETLNESHKEKLHTLQSNMKWLVHSNSLKPAVISYLKQEWHFETKPILVVLDSRGRVASSNALDLIKIWKNEAYPFTTERELQLLEKESGIQSWAQSLALRLLVDSNDRPKWDAAGKCICFFGGDSLFWIREFTKLAAGIAKAAKIELQMVYVGKSGTKERIKNIREKTKTRLNTSDKNFTWTDAYKVWYYWTCLERMLSKKLQHEIINENDLIMKEVMTLMSFDRSGQGWALICMGSEMARVNADLALQSLEDYDNWKVTKKQDFVPALRNYFRKLQESEHCNHIILPWNSGGIPEVVECWECGRKMEKFFMFRCCTD